MITQTLNKLCQCNNNAQVIKPLINLFEPNHCDKKQISLFFILFHEHLTACIVYITPYFTYCYIIICFAHMFLHYTALLFVLQYVACKGLQIMSYITVYAGLIARMSIALCYSHPVSSCLM